MKKERISFLQMFLVVLYVVSLMISNIITSKQVQMPLDIVVTGGMFIFPVTYILSDVFSEVYGYKWSRITCYLSFLFNLFMVLIFAAVIHSPSPDFWTDGEAWQTVLGNTPRVLCASFLAFVAGDFINDVVFQRMKRKHPNDHKGFGFRAIASSVCGEMVDSLIFFPIAFFGQLPLGSLAVMMATEVVFKVSYEVIILPVTKRIVRAVSGFEMRWKNGETKPE